MASPEGSMKRNDKLMPKSCELCKTRKVRCDRKNPSCTWCLRNGRICVYTERRKPGVPGRTELQVEEKVDALESNLQLLAERMDTFISKSNDTDHSDVSGDRYNDSMAMSTPGSRQEFSLQTGAVLSHNMRPGSHHSAAQLVRSRDQLAFDLSPEALDIGLQDALLEQHRLPPYQILSCLVDTFFKHVVTWAPLLTRTTIDGILSAPWLADDDTALLHGIVATTIRYSDNATLNRNDRARYYDISIQTVKNLALVGVSVRATQALTLVALEALGDSDGPEGRRLLALLIHILTYMDLGRERSSFFEPHIQHPVGRFDSSGLTRPINWIQEEERRRLVWTVYMLDCYATIGTHRGFGLLNHALNLPLPCRFDSFCNNQPAETKWFAGIMEESHSQNQDSGSFTYHCELLVILSRIHNFVERSIDLETRNQVQSWRSKYMALDSALKSWLSSLPEHANISQLCHQNPTARVANWIMLQATFVLASIRLNSVAGYPIRETQSFRYSNNARNRCLAAVDSLRRITLDITQLGGLQCLGYPYAFVLWTCAGLLLVHAAATETKVDQTIWFFINALDSQAGCWPIASHYSRILRRVLHCGERDSQESTPALSSGELKFMTMRRRAFELLDILNRTRSSIHEQLTSHIVDTDDIELVELFGFFHYPLTRTGPRQRTTSDLARDLGDEAEDHSYGSNWVLPAPQAAWHVESEGRDTSKSPDRESDWLDQRSAYELRPSYF